MTAIAELISRVIDDSSEVRNYESVGAAIDGILEGGTGISRLVQSKCAHLLPKIEQYPTRYAFGLAALNELTRDLEAEENYSSPSASVYEQSIEKCITNAEAALIIGIWQEFLPYGEWKYSEEVIFDTTSKEPRTEHYLVCGQERISVTTIDLILRPYLMAEIDYWIKRLSNHLYFNTSMDEWCEAYDVSAKDTSGVEEIESRLKRQLF